MPAAAPSTPDQHPRARPSIVAQLRAWAAISVQSIGGGAATLQLMRRTFVHRKHWIREDEFVDDWALSRLSPGIHLVAHAALVGLRIGGRTGMVVAIVALMVPAGLITLLVTATFVGVREIEAVGAAFTGVGPAAIGLTMGVAMSLGIAAARGGRVAFVDWAVFAVSAMAGLVAGGWAIGLVIIGAVGGAFGLGRATEPETTGSSRPAALDGPAASGDG